MSFRTKRWLVAGLSFASPLVAYATDAAAQPAPPPPPPPAATTPPAAGGAFGGPAQPGGVNGGGTISAQPGGFQPGGGGFQPGGGGFQPNGGPNGGFTDPNAPPPNAEPPADATSDEWKARVDLLPDTNNLYGSTGLLHSTFAGSGLAGTFRVGFLFDWMTSKSYLCDPTNFTTANASITCSANNNADSASRVGGVFNLSVTPFSFLEAYASLHTYATSDDQGSPQLLQVLGDAVIGAKGYTPRKLLGPLSAGFDAELLLLNGTGDVGLSGGSTSARFNALATLDLRDMKSKIPFRANLNIGGKIDNSGKAVQQVETARGRPITRIERYGLGISKVDYFQTALGVDVPFWFIQPFIEWSVDVPVNRQGYQCHTSTVARGDVCLGLTDLSNPNGPGAGFKYIPSRFSIGAKVSPFKTGSFRGLSGDLAFDVATSGAHAFIEEVAPESPWMMYIGLGFAFDAKERPVEKAVAPPPQTVSVPTPENLVRGLVHENGKPDAVAGAIVAFQGGGQPPLATGADGRFLSRNMAPGQYTFEISAPGFKPGTCAVVVNAPRPAMPVPMGPGFGPGFPGGPGAPPAGGGAGQFTAPPAPTGPTYTDVDCSLEALPRVGNLVGTVKDSDGKAVGGAIVTITDALAKDHKTTADGNGSFRVDGLAPGDITIKVEARDYMNHVEQGDIRANEDAKRAIMINKKPKNPLVTIQGNELKLGDKVLFENDQAKILGQSSALLEEVADVLSKHPEIQEVEVQGHTDNTGTREHNQTLSDQRAAAVRDWLVKAGIASSRLVPKGYGQDKPLAPNVTEANRAKNRRVQFIITKKTGG